MNELSLIALPLIIPPGIIFFIFFLMILTSLNEDNQKKKDRHRFQTTDTDSYYTFDTSYTDTHHHSSVGDFSGGHCYGDSGGDCGGFDGGSH